MVASRSVSRVCRKLAVFLHDVSGFQIESVFLRTRSRAMKQKADLDSSSRKNYFFVRVHSTFIASFLFLQVLVWLCCKFRVDSVRTHKLQEEVDSFTVCFILKFQV